MRQRFVFLCICWLGVLCVSSCTSDDPKAPDELRVRLAGEPDGLSPLLARSSYSWQLIDLIFQPLMQFDPEQLSLVPVLVTAPPEVVPWEGPAGRGQAYTFEIRKEARWDNGESITARDYVFTLKCIFHPLIPNIFHAYLDFIHGVRIDPENPRRFTVYCADEYFLAKVATANFELYPAHAYDPSGVLAEVPLADFLDPDKREQLRDKPALQSFAEQFLAVDWRQKPERISGSGAYELAEWRTGESLLLRKKSDWWGSDLVLPQLEATEERLRYRVVPDINTAMALLKSEELDVLANIPGRQFLEFKETGGWAEQYAWYQVPQLSYYYIALNRKNPKLEDQRVRKALAHILNQSKLIAQVMNGLAEPTIGPFSPSSSYYHPKLKPIAYAPERARQLLAEAGWADADGNGVLEKEVAGQPEELHLVLDISTGSTTGQQVALLFRDEAQKVGVKVEVQQMDFSQLADRLRKGTFDLSYLARINRPGEVDPTQDWYADRQKGGRSNYSNFGNAASDALIDSLRHCPEASQRKIYYHRLQRLIYEDQPVLFVAVPQNRIAVHRRYQALISQRSPNYFPARFVPQNMD